MSPTLSRLAAIPAAAVLLAALAGPATAHAELVSSVPEDGAVLEVPPGEVTLRFSEGVDAGKSSFRLLGPGGEVGTAKPAEDGATVMRLRGLALAPGDYSIRWTVGSGDGHLERGTLRFTVLEAAPAPTAATPAPAAPTGTPSAPSPGPASPSPASPSPATPATPAASAGPSPTPGDVDVVPAAASGGDVLVPIVAALVLVAGMGLLVLRRSRT